ncbi:VWA domain-containing protein [Candidatus Pacearchaeota archaeon]|nr:VWA domain-containing protein [Candidatus Pacearchaeota archaeon]
MSNEEKDIMAQMTAGSGYQFSAVNLDNVEAAEVTLVTIVVDTSYSLMGQAKSLEEMIKAAVGSCQKSPRAENVMIRVVTFNTTDHEKHGFKLLSGIDVDDYDNSITISGTTLLYDSCAHALEAVQTYSGGLNARKYLNNAILFFITDGWDTHSTYTPTRIKELISTIRKSEDLESLSTVLIGMNEDPDVQQFLDKFKNEADLDYYHEMGDVTKEMLARLAGWLSQSIQSSSEAIGTGGPSKTLGSVSF